MATAIQTSPRRCRGVAKLGRDQRLRGPMSTLAADLLAVGGWDRRGRRSWATVGNGRRCRGDRRRTVGCGKWGTRSAALGAWRRKWSSSGNCEARRWGWGHGPRGHWQSWVKGVERMGNGRLHPSTRRSQGSVGSGRRSTCRRRLMPRKRCKRGLATGAWRRKLSRDGNYAASGRRPLGSAVALVPGSD